MSEQPALPGFEDLIVEDEQISYEEAQRISFAAQEAFEELLDDPERPEAAPLKDPFRELCAQGWDWRKALYVAWAKLPIRGRWPRTQEELAEVLGLRSARTIRKWRERNPGIDFLVSQARAGVITERTVEVLNKSFEVATAEGYKGFNDRKMLLEIDGVYRQKQDISVTTPVNADDMARKQEAAAAEIEDWEASRFGSAGADPDDSEEEDDQG